MLNQINRILLLGTIIIYVVVFKFLIVPLLSGVQSTHTIQQELVQLQQHRITQLSRLSFLNSYKISGNKTSCPRKIYCRFF